MVIRETIDIHNLINIKIVLLKFLLIERVRVSTIFDVCYVDEVLNPAS